MRESTNETHILQPPYKHKFIFHKATQTHLARKCLLAGGAGEGLAGVVCGNVALEVGASGQQLEAEGTLLGIDP